MSLPAMVISNMTLRQFINHTSGHFIDRSGRKGNVVDWNGTDNFMGQSFSGEVEILTEKGFQRFDELDKSLKVAQVNKGKIEFVKPLRHTQYTSYNNYRVHLPWDDYIDLTSNHTIHFRTPKGEYQNEELQNVDYKTVIFKSSYPSKMESEELTNLERLKIAYQADGYKRSNSAIGFRFKNLHKVNRLEHLLNELDLTYRLSKYCDVYEFYINNLIFSKILSEEFDLTMSYVKANQFIQELALWDSNSHSSTGHFEYSSTVKENIDFVSAVTSLAGGHSRLIKPKLRADENHKVLHRIGINLNKDEFRVNLSEKEFLHYPIQAYCIEVSSGLIVVRTKKGLVHVSHNCASLVLAWLRMNNIVNAPQGHAKDYINLPNSKRVTNPVNGDLIVWSKSAPPYGHIGIYYNGRVFNQNPHRLRFDTLTRYGPYTVVRPDYKTNTKGVIELRLINVVWDLGRINLPNAGRFAYRRIPKTQAQANKPDARLPRGLFEINGIYTHKEYKGVDLGNRKVTFSYVLFNGLKYYVAVYNSDSVQFFTRQKPRLDL